MGKMLTARAFCHEIDHLNGILFTSLTDELLTPEQLDELRQEEEELEDAEACDAEGTKHAEGGEVDR